MTSAPGLSPMAGRLVAIGMKKRRLALAAAMLGPVDPRHGGDAVLCCADPTAARRLAPAPGDRLLCDDPRHWPAVHGLARRAGATARFVGDGWLVGAGAPAESGRGREELPQSLLIDNHGPHDDPDTASGLERLLNETVFDPALLTRARAVRMALLRLGISRHNWLPPDPPDWDCGRRRVVLVAGEDERRPSKARAAGAVSPHGVSTNRALLAAVRACRPGAYIVYKPHPASPGVGGVNARLADHVETRASIAGCLALADEVHVISSQAGLDGLIHGRRVLCWGMPFYAGWGLSEDMISDHPALARRSRRLDIDELIAGALLLHTRYWNPAKAAETTCEAMVAALAAARSERLARPKGLGRLWPALAMGA